MRRTVSKVLTEPFLIQGLKKRQMWEGTLSQRIRSGEKQTQRPME